MKIKDVYVGFKLNHLEVVDMDSKNFTCKCFCGNIKAIDKSNFVKGGTKSCGCLKRLSYINNRIEYIGKRFGMLQVVDFYEVRNNDIHYKCLCDCGNVAIVNKHKLRTGHSTSCGCYKSIWCKENKTKHNGKLKHKREYSIWQGMRSRCRDKTLKNYGAKGIEVCEEWDDFEVFLKDMGKCPFTDAQIDRINSNGNYEPSNCRWVTSTINNANKRKKDTWGLRYNKNGCCEVTISREYIRRRYIFSSVEEAKIYRDIWVIEYEENPIKWIESTLNNKYKECLP